MVDRDTLDRRVRGVLAASRPRALRHGCWAVAVGTTHIPYHGRPLDDEDELFRSQAKGGTTRSHANATAYATAFATRNGLRFTRAILPVRGHTPMHEVVRELRRRVAAAGVRVRRLLLHMPQVVHGKKPRSGILKGLRLIRATHPTGWTTYTWTPAQQRAVTVDLCVVRRRRKRRHGHRAFLYACGGVRMSARGVYRTRFGIETSYRQMNQLRVRTCTRNPALRLRFVAVALILRNRWAWLHWVVLSVRVPGGRRLRLKVLRLRTMARWLLHRTEQLLGWIDHTVANHPPDEPLVNKRRLRA